MRSRRIRYDMLAWGALAISGIAALLAAAGVALGQGLAGAASGLCALLFVVPGLYFLGFSRSLRSRDVALAHAASFAAARKDIRIQDLAAEMHVTQEDAERILRTAVAEGHVRGQFEGHDRFVADRVEPQAREGAR